jgi:hypothetical protein
MTMEQKRRLQKDDPVAAAAKDTSRWLQHATWPESFPHPEETHFLSIVAGNSTLSWAMHETEQGYAPKLLWK